MTNPIVHCWLLADHCWLTIVDYVDHQSIVVVGCQDPTGLDVLL
jgi:hypothetical protein